MRVPFGRFVIAIWLGAALSASTSSVAGPDDSRKELVLGVFAFRPNDVIENRFAPLGAYLSERLAGYQIIVKPLSTQELEDGIHRGTVDFVLTNPAHYIKLKEGGRLSGALASMVMRQGNHPVYGIGGVIVRQAARTDLNSLQDLGSKRIAIAGRHYLGTYLAPVYELKQAGVDLDSISWVETSQPVDQVITTVLEGKADAGFVRTGVLEQLESEGKLHLNDLAVLHPQNLAGFEYRISTRLYPEWPFLAVNHTDPSVSRQITTSLLALRPEHPAALAADIYGFAIPADYSSVENAMRELRMAPFDSEPISSLAAVWSTYKAWIIVLFALVFALIGLSLSLVLQRGRLIHTQAKLSAEHDELARTTDRLNYLMASSPVMFYTLRVVRHQTEPTWVSSNILPLLGYTPAEACDRNWWKAHIHPDDLHDAVYGMRQLHILGRIRQTYRFANASGDYQWFDTEVSLLSPSRDGCTEALGMWRNVTQAKLQDAQLRLAASVFENSYDGVLITDCQHRIVDANPAFERLIGRPVAEVIGTPMTSVLAQDTDMPSTSGVSDTNHGVGIWKGEVTLLNSRGPKACAMSVSAVMDANGKTGHHVVLLSDISINKAHQAELDRMAYYDPLTGVPNRRLLVDRLSQALDRARRGNHALAVCYLDLDNFKPVNDQFGHAAGDQLLVEITQRIQHILRGHDTLARLGGDEFVLLLTDLHSTGEWRSVMERLLQAVQKPIALQGQQVKVSCSVGVAVFPQDDADADTLLRHADQAMYEAKKAGRNCCHVFDSTEDREAQARRDQLSRLADGLHHNELVLHFQPTVDLSSGDVVGAEALIRWQHPDKGLLSPAAFLWQAGGTPLEIEMGEWVIDTALAQLSHWKQTRPWSIGPGFHMSVNLSGNQLLSTGFLASLRRMLDRHTAVHPSELELEILESTAIADTRTAASVMAECRALGVRFALDDFGTGYSSLAYFRSLPVDEIKIDQSFVRDMLHDPDDHGIVQTVVYLAHALQRPVIAEGVETLDHAAALLRLGCNLVQGYGIARPMPAADWAGWVQRWQTERAWTTLLDSYHFNS